MTPADVRMRAACRTADPEIFHAPDRAEAAKGYCRSCAVTTACLAWALEINDTHAVLGGTTAGERAAMSGITTDRRCVECETPIVPRARPVPPGHSTHAGNGFCEGCAYRRRKVTK